VPRPGLAFVAITAADICGEIEPHAATDHGLDLRCGSSAVKYHGVGRRYGPSARERPAHLRRPANMRVSRPW